MKALDNMAQWISGNRVCQFGGGCDKAFELMPPAGSFGGRIKRCPITLCFQKSRAQSFE